MSWNKEKITFTLSLALLCWFTFQFAGSLFLGNPLEDVQLQNPSPSSAGVVGASVRIDWFEPNSLGSLARDPFQSVSDWRGAPADPLGFPPIPALMRRIPAPAPLKDVATARLTVEVTPPEPVSSSTNSGGE